MKSNVNDDNTVNADVAFRLRYNGEEGVTPDPLVKCPQCSHRFRVGKRQG